MKNKKAVGLLELVIVITILAIIASVSTFVYFKTTKQDALAARAKATIDTIRNAEYEHKFNEGNYVAAENTAAINELLNLTIEPRYYEYKVVGVTDDNFIVIAMRIGADISAYLAANQPPPEPLVIVYNNVGLGNENYADYLSGGSSTAQGTSQTSSASSGGLDDDESYFGGAGGSISSGGSYSPGGTSGYGSGNTRAPASGTVTTEIPEPTYSTELQDAFNIMQADALGAYYYDLIQRKKISANYVNPYDYGLDQSVRAWWDWSENGIFVNEALMTEAPASVAATLTHEALHADYFYYPETHIAETLARHPELTRDQINICRDEFGNEMVFDFIDPETGEIEQRIFIFNSIDQEYVARVEQVGVWSRNKGSAINGYLDYLEDLFAQPDAEALVKDYIRSIPSYSLLPEY